VEFFRSFFCQNACTQLWRNIIARSRLCPTAVLSLRSDRRSWTKVVGSRSADRSTACPRRVSFSHRSSRSTNVGSALLNNEPKSNRSAIIVVNKITGKKYRCRCSIVDKWRREKPTEMVWTCTTRRCRKRKQYLSVRTVVKMKEEDRKRSGGRIQLRMLRAVQMEFVRGIVWSGGI